MKFQDTSTHRLKVKKKVVRTHGHTDKPKAICPTNFFKVGGINRTVDFFIRHVFSRYTTVHAIVCCTII